MGGKMRAFLYLLATTLTLFAAVGLSLSAAHTDRYEGSPLTLGIGGDRNKICAFGDSVWGFSPGGSGSDTLDTGCLGVEFDGTHFWVTGRDASHGDVHKLHKFDMWGVHDTSYLQGTSSLWGWRDLAWDGQYLYASDAASVVQIDPATGGVTGVSFAGPVNPCRALAYDPATDHFYTASFSSMIYEFDRSGTTIGSWANSNAIYGMAWDDVSSDGPWLWVTGQDPGTVIHQWDPINHVYTGLMLDVTIASGMAGGAAFTTEWDPSLGILFVLHQEEPFDLVIGYEITEAAGRDVHPDAIDSPGGLVMPGIPVTPMVTVSNTGDSTETFYTLFLVDSAGTNVYTDSVEVMGLMADSIFQVSFPDWTPDGQGNVYDLTCITNSATDEAHGNDTLSAMTMAFLVDSLIPCGWASIPPSIDGIISGPEWANAYVVDISDILAEGSVGVVPNSVILYAMNNATHLYLAVDYLEDASEDVNDRVTVYLDENNDDAWAADSSEGNYWAFRSSGGPRLMYRPLPAGPFTDPIPGAAIGMSTLINVQYEFSIPLGIEKYELDAGLGDTMGMHIYAHDQGVNEAQGWWLQTMAAANQDDPVYYGHIVLHVLDAVEESERFYLGRRFGLVGAQPSPFSLTSRVLYAIEAREVVSLKVHDSSGRVVRNLFEGTEVPGVHEVTWDGRDDGGRDLPSGVYFYTLSSGNRVSSLKSVLLR
jgi:hypothetical protein